MIGCFAVRTRKRPPWCCRPEERFARISAPKPGHLPVAQQLHPQPPNHRGDLQHLLTNLRQHGRRRLSLAGGCQRIPTGERHEFER
jgi:hypothetical protein